MEKETTINDRLITNFRDINHTMRSLYEGRGSQKRILIMLLESGIMSQRKLTKQLGIQPGSASEVIAKLERGGLIVRTENPDDRRTTDIVLTAEGKRLAQEAAARRTTRHEEMFSCLGEEEKSTLLALLEKVNGYWQERYGDLEDRFHDRHGRGREHEWGHEWEHGRRKSHSHDSGSREGCDGNCRECPHPCGRSQGRREREDGHGGGNYHHGNGRR